MSVPAPRSPGGVARLLDTAAGLMIVEATRDGIARLQQVDVADLHAVHGAEVKPAELRELDPAEHAAGTGNVAAGAEGHIVRLAEQLEAYLAGTAREFDVPLDWAAAGVHDEFSREVYREIQHIPYGETDTYGQISVDAGRPRSARRVGRLCSLVPVPFVIPVHRVIRADGGMGNCPAYRLRLLHHERNAIEAERVGKLPPQFA